MKKEVHGFFYKAGCPMLLRALLRRKLTILTYHGFRKDDDANEFTPFIGNHLSVRRLEQQLIYIRRHYVPLSLGEAFDRMRAGTLPANALVLTIDDGYASICRLAYPLFCQYGVPATVFLSTAFLDRRAPFWFDRLTYAIARTQCRSIVLSLGGEKRVFVLDGVVSRQECRQFISAYAKSCSQDKRDDLIAHIESQLGVALLFGPQMPAVFQPLSWDEVREMRASRMVSFGPHGDGHYILSRCSESMQREDIVRSFGRLSDELKSRPRFFAYPNGEAGDFGPALYPLLGSLGIEGACSTIHGFNGRGGDVYALRRISILDWMELPDFALQIVLFVKVLARIKQFPAGVMERIAHACRPS
jgi:peptidoglycan/xylan/chitin deacetylase (PgdA/CDA1 family)